MPERTRIVAWAFVVMFAAVAPVAWRHGWSEEGARQVVRLSAEIGVVLFSLAFSASSIRVFWRTPASAWLLRNRRYVGLSFGSWRRWEHWRSPSRSPSSAIGTRSRWRVAA